MDSPQRSGRWLRWWIFGYVVLVSVVIVVMIQARELSPSVSDWNAWREDVRDQQSRPGPVERRVPKSDEPPSLVLLRDYFPVMMVGALLFTSLLYWIIAWFITGIMKSSQGNAHGFHNPPHCNSD